MASKKAPGLTPTVQLQPTPTVHVHQPGKTIQQAINNANAP